MTMETFHSLIIGTIGFNVVADPDAKRQVLYVEVPSIQVQDKSGAWSSAGFSRTGFNGLRDTVEQLSKLPESIKLPAQAALVEAFIKSMGEPVWAAMSKQPEALAAFVTSIDAAFNEAAPSVSASSSDPNNKLGDLVICQKALVDAYDEGIEKLHAELIAFVTGRTITDLESVMKYVKEKDSNGRKDDGTISPKKAKGSKVVTPAEAPAEVKPEDQAEPQPE